MDERSTPTSTGRPADGLTVRVVSPFADEPTSHRPRWYERLRGVVGLAGLVVLMGVMLAVLVGVALLVFAVVVALTVS